MTLRIDYVSDLHWDHHWQRTKLYDPTNSPRIKDDNGNPIYFDWEYYKKQNKDKGNVLVIAGDTSNSVDFTIEVIEQAIDAYDEIIFVDGNHEHYNRKLYSENITKLENALKQYLTVTYLNHNNPYIIIDKVAFIGACGWYDWQCYEDEGFTAAEAKEDWKRGLNDRIIQFDQGDPEIMARRDARILSKITKDLQNDDNVNNIIVITHSSPLKDLMHISEDPFWNRLTPSFVNSQMRDVIDTDLNNKIKYWIYGHTHFRKIETIGNITYVNNAYGYTDEFPNEVWSLKQVEI